MKRFLILFKIENNSLHIKESMLSIENAIVKACEDNDSKIRYYIIEDAHGGG